MADGFALGDVTIQRIIEGESPLFDPLTFFPTLTKDLLEENRAWLEPFALDPATGKLILCIQSWVVRTKHHTILVDTCVGNDKDRPNHPFWNRMRSDAYMRGLAALGLTVDDIDIVMCTHMHVDHVGWNTRLENGRWVPTFPKARHLMPKAEYDFWRAEYDKGDTQVQSGSFADSVLPVVEAGMVDFYGPGQEVAGCLLGEDVSGHAPGMIALRLRSKGEEGYFSTDTMHSPIQVAYPHWNDRYVLDADKARVSRAFVLRNAAEREALIMPMHFGAPYCGYVRRQGDGYRFEAASW